MSATGSSTVAPGRGIIDASGSGNHGSLYEPAQPGRPASHRPSRSTIHTRSPSMGRPSGNATLGVTNLPANNAAQSVSFWVNPADNTGTQSMFAMTNPGQ